MTQPISATSASSVLGKILRMTRDGRHPAGPLARNSLLANSYLHPIGVRDSVALTTDAPTGETWFVEAGPGDEDALNCVGRPLNCGWGAAMQAGYQDMRGREDPFHVWSPAIAPSDLSAHHEMS